MEIPRYGQKRALPPSDPNLPGSSTEPPKWEHHKKRYRFADQEPSEHRGRMAASSIPGENASAATAERASVAGNMSTSEVEMDVEPAYPTMSPFHASALRPPVESFGFPSPVRNLAIRASLENYSRATRIENDGLSHPVEHWASTASLLNPTNAASAQSFSTLTPDENFAIPAAAQNFALQPQTYRSSPAELMPAMGWSVPNATPQAYGGGKTVTTIQFSEIPEITLPWITFGMADKVSIERVCAFCNQMKVCSHNTLWCQSCAKFWSPYLKKIWTEPLKGSSPFNSGTGTESRFDIKSPGEF